MDEYHISPTKERMAKLGEGDLAEITPSFSGKLHAVENISTLKSRNFLTQSVKLHTNFSNGIWEIHKIFSPHIFLPAVPSNLQSPFRLPTARARPSPRIGAWDVTSPFGFRTSVVEGRDSLDVYFLRDTPEIVFWGGLESLIIFYFWGYFVAKEVDCKLKRSRSQTKHMELKSRGKTSLPWKFRNSSRAF